MPFGSVPTSDMNWRGLAIGDVDSDGHGDVAFTGQDIGAVEVQAGEVFADIFRGGFDNRCQ